MRKYLLLVVLFLTAVQWNGLRAQGLFTAPDTVCIRQKVKLTTLADASSYYWGFCSGFLVNTPVAANLGTGFQLNGPSSIEVAKDGNNYYAFVVNRTNNELLRLNYGTSLANLPTVTNFGNLNNTMPAQPNKISIAKDALGKWFIFATGGSTPATSTLARIDFNNSLGSVPNSVNFGNLGNLLNGPSGVFVSQDGTNYFGYVVNGVNNRLIRLTFGANISFTPTTTDLGNIGGLNGPSDIAAVQELGNWFLLVPNAINNTLSRIAFGTTLGNAPVGTNLGTLGNSMNGPSGITIIKDCGATYGFVTSRTTNELVRINIGTLAAGPFTANNLGNVNGAFASPADISRVVRENDNLYAYSINSVTNALVKVTFPQCTNSSIPSSTLKDPPTFIYDVPGYYNVYLSVNEGLPNAAVQCKQIRVLPIPYITLHNDTTICQGDTIQLITQSPGALSYTYSPFYHLSDSQGISIFAYPDYTVKYALHIPYANGCIVDTSLTIKVKKIKADAGPDRIISDGASTSLGGPLTTTGPQYFYEWTPQQFLTSPNQPVTKADPSHDLIYYLKVSDTTGCVSRDTVTVHVMCSKLNLPNAFRPESTGSTRLFSILNREIVKLNYFRIYDRWGREIFTTTDVTKGWDGTVNGNPAPFGVYVWEADGFCTSGLRITQSGNVTLVR